MLRPPVPLHIPDPDTAESIADPPGDRQGGKQGQKGSDCQCRRKPADRPRSKDVQDGSGNQGRDLPVKDGGKCLVKALL